MNSLIIGKGEVGKSLYSLLSKVYTCYIQDKDSDYCGDIDVLHICFPYSKDFVGDVKDYIEIYRPNYTVIHSTVPVGTSTQCGAFYSPIRGKHPDLEKGLKTFVKYLAPRSTYLKKYFANTGIKVRLADLTNDLEALKLFDTAQYGISIIVQKLIYRYCKDLALDFNIVYTDANKTYNEGYAVLGLKNVIRPILKHKEGKIGGHCVIQNCDLISSPITNFIKRQNKEICEF